MISRVAESCFWLHRYMERAESMARLLRVNRAFLLDANLAELERWHPVLIVSGEQHRFPELHPAEAAEDGEVVQQYLTWDERCLVGIVPSIYWARENARTIREVISLEMWEALNQLWHWLKGGQGRRAYCKDRDTFYARVKNDVALFHGLCHNTMMHEEPFDFMRLGMLLERAGQTARIMDVKFHQIGPTRGDAAETPLESAQWLALLRSLSGSDNFSRRRHSGFSGVEVAEFLLKEERFPRSVFHNLSRAWNFLKRIQAATGGVERPSGAILEALVEDLRRRSIADILSTGLHEELTGVIDTVARICETIHGDYFDPSFPELREQAGAQASP